MKQMGSCFLFSISLKKGAPKLYFMHYSCVAIILFSTGFHSTYSFVKLCFRHSHVPCLFFLSVQYFAFEFILNDWTSLRSLILFSRYIKDLLKHKNHVRKNMLPERSWVSLKETRNSYICVTPKILRLMFFS